MFKIKLRDGVLNINLDDTLYIPGEISHINVNKDNVVIKGSDSSKAVFDSKLSNSSIMTIVGDNVRLENIIFKNCNCIKWSGAIKINGKSCTIVNCEFIDNSGHIGAMGISDNASNVLIKNCYFENNMANNPSPDSGGSGGAIDSHASQGHYINCTFVNNSAVGSGGALVFLLGYDNYVEDCIFINNYAHNGGAVYLANTGSRLFIRNSKFINNSADYGGGFSSYSEGSVIGCSMINNTARDGGCIYNIANLSVYDSLFVNNKVSNNGGVLYNKGNLTINYTNFTNNGAYCGGSIYNIGSLNIFNSNFNKNRAYSKLIVSVPSFVNCSDNAIVKVTFNGGNNINNVIWSNQAISFNGNILKPNSYISSQTIILKINGKTFSVKTDKYGITTFKFNTKNFARKNHIGTVNYGDDDYYSNSTNFNLKITTKLVYKIKIKNIKKIKKVKKYQVYLPSTKYIKVKYQILYYKPYPKLGKAFLQDVDKGVKKIKKLQYKWKKANKKTVNSKYKWYKSRYYYTIKYKATKITYKYLNGKLAKKIVNKNYKYTKNSKYKIKRSKDWSKYVLPSVDCESDNKQIIKLSKKIIKNEAKKLKKPVSKLTDSQKAHAILYWVQKHITYKKYGDTRKGAAKTLKYKEGNCADQTHLAIALLRASNIPAKYETKVVKIKGEEKGHAWHLAYFKNKWWAGESTDYVNCPKYGKSKFLQYYIKTPAVYNIHKISHKFISKYVKYKNKWCKFYEQQFINNNWKVYNGNLDGSIFTSFKYTIGGNLNG